MYVLNLGNIEPTLVTGFLGHLGVWIASCKSDLQHVEILGSRIPLFNPKTDYCNVVYEIVYSG